MTSSTVPKTKMIEIKNLAYEYPGHTISYPDWHVEEKSSALVLGQSGSGKTTFLDV
jgi:ABC-type molybdenum transport system ATPase subunit/photorepair protein PhrA